MRILLAFLLAAAAIGEAQIAPVPMADEINGRPYLIRDKWKIGGNGTWGYLALDPVSRELFIAHQTSVQVLDIDSGQLIGEITGFEEARSIALDPDGQFGYVGDAKANLVAIFDRRSFRLEARRPIACSPRSLVLAPQQQLLLAICGSATPAPVLPNFSRPRLSGPPGRTRWSAPDQQREPAKGDSKIALFDTDKQALVGYVTSPGDFHAAVAGTNGQVFITAGPAERINLAEPLGSRRTFPQGIVRFDAGSAIAKLRGEDADAESGISPEAHDEYARSRRLQDRWRALGPDESPDLAFKPLDSSCPNPQGIAVDSHNGRLFVACDNQKLLVIDAQAGNTLDALTTGPGTDAIAYDENRGLIFTANGGGYGSVTVIRQHISDSYAVIQNLPTMERARTMAVDPGTGQVYLVTDLHGARLDNPPANGIGKLKLEPVDGSFQVLVIAN